MNVKLDKLEFGFIIFIFCIGTPTSSRMSPLSIVNDLLRKVGALETKLQTYHKKDEATMKKCRSIDSKNHQNKYVLR